MATKASARVWDAALGQLQLQMTRANFDTWLKDTFLVSHDDGEGLFVIGVGSPFAVDTLEQRLSPVIRRVLSGIVGRDVQLKFVVQQKRRGRTSRETEMPLEPSPLRRRRRGLYHPRWGRGAIGSRQ